MPYPHVDITGSQCFDIDLKKAPVSPFYTKISDLNETMQDDCIPSDDISITSSSSDNDSPIASARSSILFSADRSDDEDVIERFNKKTSLLESQRFEHNVMKPLKDFNCTPTIIDFKDGSLQHSQTYNYVGSEFPMTRTIQKSGPAFIVFGGCSSKAFEEQVDALLAPKEPIQVMVEVEVLVQREAEWDEAVKRALHQAQRRSKRDAIYVEN
ncbi:hypothetical protein CPB85DRAFT_1253219 [Mucidula mucida]|nr:hypothetical protein CPB85DRAFT_1253219 [Mucidula mucida]